MPKHIPKISRLFGLAPGRRAGALGNGSPGLSGLLRAAALTSSR